jgi:hypothetical protein
MTTLLYTLLILIAATLAMMCRAAMEDDDE